MKRIAEVILLVMAATVILTVFSRFQGVQAQTPEPQNQDTGSRRTVTVNGTGSVQVTPDRATVNVGVETEAETAEEALQQNNTQMQSLITALVNEGIARENIQTQTVQLFPRYQDQRTGETTAQQVIGYTAINLVMVTVDNIDNLGGLLDTIVQAGGNRIQGIIFTVSDPTQAMNEARSAAMEQARQKAEQLATLAEGELGEVTAISETSFTPGPVFGRGGMFAAEKAADVPIEPGTQIVEVNLQVVWALTGGAAESQ